MLKRPSGQESPMVSGLFPRGMTQHLLPVLRRSAVGSHAHRAVHLLPRVLVLTGECKTADFRQPDSPSTRPIGHSPSDDAAISDKDSHWHLPATACEAVVDELHVIPLDGLPYIIPLMGMDAASTTTTPSRLLRAEDQGTLRPQNDRCMPCTTARPACSNGQQLNVGHAHQSRPNNSCQPQQQQQHPHVLSVLETSQLLQPPTLQDERHTNQSSQPHAPHAASHHQSQAAQKQQQGLPSRRSLAAGGALLLLTVSYIHQACNSFALPAMLPAISTDLHLADMEGALLTTGYSYLYALALLPIGVLADRMPRPKLLAAGVASWSALTMLTAGARSFGELLMARVGFAAAQAVQNPISFALIPELFPRNKSAALALYNCAIYLGRALSFRAALAAEDLSKLVPTGAAAVVPDQACPLLPSYDLIYPLLLERLDLDLGLASAAGSAAALPSVASAVIPGVGSAVLPNSLQMTAAIAAALEGVAGSAGNVVQAAAEVTDGLGSWREVLKWVAMPGFAIALALVFALPEPRDAAKRNLQEQQQQQVPPAAAGRALCTEQQQQQRQAAVPGSSQAASDALKQQGKQQQVAAASTTEPRPSFMTLLRSPMFLTTTLAAAFNDVGSYALLGWQSTFYERVYHLEPSTYAPVLAVVLPIGGIIGGVGGGWVADRAAASGRSTAWMTAGATALAAPLMLWSLMAGTPEESFAALMVGFALSEAWRAPAANMARSAAPPSMGSSTVSLYLCIRNLVGGLGPLAVALLTQLLGDDLQKGMLLIPATYVVSAALFMVAEGQFSLHGKDAAGCSTEEAAKQALAVADDGSHGGAAGVGSMSAVAGSA